MDNRQELLKKLHLLVQEIDKAKEMVDEEKSQYLNNYENRIEALIKKLQDGTLPASKGGLIGTMRGISEYDSLASIKALYDAASDVDLFYSKECQKWSYIILIMFPLKDNHHLKNKPQSSNYSEWFSLMVM